MSKYLHYATDNCVLTLGTIWVPVSFGLAVSPPDDMGYYTEINPPLKNMFKLPPYLVQIFCICIDRRKVAIEEFFFSVACKSPGMGYYPLMVIYDRSRRSECGVSQSHLWLDQL